MRLRKCKVSSPTSSTAIGGDELMVLQSLPHSQLKALKLGELFLLLPQLLFVVLQRMIWKWLNISLSPLDTVGSVFQRVKGDDDDFADP